MWPVPELRKHDAGQKFQAIAQQDLQNTSALHNWAKSICIRASLKDNAEVSPTLPSPLLSLLPSSRLTSFTVCVDVTFGLTVALVSE